MPRDVANIESQVFPDTLGACADLLYQVYHERLKAQKEVDKIQKQETEIKDYIISRLTKENSGAMGLIACVERKTDTIPTIEDWDAFYKYVKRNNRFDMLQKRLANKAIEEVWESGKKVPGVKTFEKVSLSITKK